MNIREKGVFLKVKLRNLERKYKRLNHNSEEAVATFDEIQKLKHEISTMIYKKE